MKKRVGIIGGTFDPVHIGHLVAADQVLFYNQLDQVWFMPAFKPPHKMEQAITDYQHRVAMLELVAELNPSYQVCTIEGEREGPSYTYDTIIELQKLYPEIEFNFVIGADIFNTLTKWYRINELVQLIKFIGLNRINCEKVIIEKSILEQITMVPMPQLEISSSLIREYVLDGRGLDYLVPKPVEEYIKEHQIYVAAD